MFLLDPKAQVFVPPNVSGSEVQRVGELEIDHRGQAVYLDGERIDLTTTEWSLLVALAGDPHRAFTREELFRLIWRCDSYGSSRTLDAHACRLRAKLSLGSQRYVINRWGVGYQLVEPIPAREANEFGLQEVESAGAPSAGCRYM